MTDPLRIVHSAEQPTFEELREQYREENRQRVHAMLRPDSITFRDKNGNLLRDGNGNVVRKSTGYMTDAPVGQDHRRLDEARAQGQVIPAFSNEFVIPSSPGLARELRDLERDVKALEESERVQHPEVESLEGPELKSLADEAVVDYMDRMKETNGSEVKCSATAPSNDAEASTTAATETGSG